MISEELLSFPRIHPSWSRKPQEKLRHSGGKAVRSQGGYPVPISLSPFPFTVHPWCGQSRCLGPSVIHPQFQSYGALGSGQAVPNILVLVNIRGGFAGGLRLPLGLKGNTWARK